MRMTKKRREAEAAAATAAMAEPDTAGKRARIRRLNAGIDTISANANRWERTGFPNCAASARSIVARMEAKLEEVRRV